MVENPADGLVITVLSAQVLLIEEHAATTSRIPQVQPGEGNQCVIQRRPEIKTLEQASTGVSDGVGPTPALQFGGREGIFE